MHSETETPRMCESWQGQAVKAVGLGVSGTCFLVVSSAYVVCVFCLWVSSGALVSAGQPRDCICVFVCAYIYVAWLSVWAPWAPAYCCVLGVVCVHVSLEEPPDLCVSASVFASLCVTVCLGLYVCEREGESLNIWVDTAS